MPSHVLRCEPDGDLYCVWSTVVEAPTAIGSRSDMVAHLTRQTPAGYQPIAGNTPEARVARADRTGSSALWPSEGDPFGGWGDSLIYEQRGILPREKLGALCAIVGTDPYDEAAAVALLTPFEDDDDD